MAAAQESYVAPCKVIAGLEDGMVAAQERYIALFKIIAVLEEVEM